MERVPREPGPGADSGHDLTVGHETGQRAGRQRASRQEAGQRANGEGADYLVEPVWDDLPPDPQLDAKNPRKGRGAVSNAASRYVKTQSVREDDGWAQAGVVRGNAVVTEGEEPVRTQLLVDRTQRLIVTNSSPDIPFDQSINPYKGCEHGCVYCYARPTHAFLDLSPGLDFETKIFRKAQPRQHLLQELARPSYRCSQIAMGTNTDPYQPLERSQRVTREILETLLEHKHPVSIVTKSKMVLRDLDLLQEFAAQDLVHVNISVTTMSNDLKTRLEPRTASPAARLRTIAELRAAGVPTGAMVAPVIPFINDHELESIVEAVAAAGAQFVSYILLRLPLEVAPMFREWLSVHYPGQAKRVMAAVQSSRGGQDYRAQWHKRMVGEGPFAELLKARFAAISRKLNLGDTRPTLRTDLFTPPPRPGKGAPNDRQMRLF